MSDYASRKVPELKALLQERSLPTSGNKGDLIKRLEANDKTTAAANAPAVEAAPAAEAKAPAATDSTLDEIDWDEDNKDAAPVKVSAITPPTQPAPVTSEPAVTASIPSDPAMTADAEPAAGSTAPEAAQDGTAKPIFTQNLDPTDPAEIAKKRAEREKRFGKTHEDGTEEEKLARRREKFGDASADVTSKLDSALADDPRKRKNGPGDRKPHHRGGGGGAGRDKDRNGHGGQGGGRRNRRNGRRGRDDRPGARPQGVEKARPGDAGDAAKRREREARFAT